MTLLLLFAVVPGGTDGDTEVRQHRAHRGAARQQPGHHHQWAHHPRTHHDTASPHQHTQGLYDIYNKIILSLLCLLLIRDKK